MIFLSYQPIVIPDIDVSGILSSIFQFIIFVIKSLLNVLDHIIVLPYTSLLMLMVGLIILRMIVWAFFVGLSGDFDDDE